MKKILLILLLAYCKVFSQVTDKIVEIEKEKYLKSFIQSELNYPGDPSFDVTYYKLNLNITYEPSYLIGEVTISAKSKLDDLTSFFLDLSDILTVDSVKSDNDKLNFSHSENILTIQTDQSYNLNENFNITVFYRGVPQRTGLGSFVFDTHNGQPSIWTLSEPYGARDWWPCKDTPADKADSADIWVTCSSDLFAVSNGKLIETVDNRNGTYTYKWKSSYPMANYLISLAISDFTFYQQYFKYSPNDSMPVVHYIYPDIFPNVKEQLDKTILMLEIFSEYFGLYPFIREKYGHASFGRGGMEHQTISSMGAFNDGVISHELAHQWFGDKVTCKDWHHIWLNEGFATYGEAIFHEIAEDREAYNTFINTAMSSAKNAVGSIYVQNINSISEIFNGARSYAKGAIVLHMLRGITGDSLFFRILRNYLDDPELAYGTAVTEDFQRIAEEIYSSSLDYFFRQWIYGENYPHYYIDWDYTTLDNNLFEVRLNIDQAVNTYPLFFTMPVQIKIETAIKDTIVTLFNNQQKQSFTFIVEGEPKGFTFDPDNNILEDSFINDPFNLDIPRNFDLFQNYPNPFNTTTIIEFNTSVRERVIIKIFDLLGNEVADIFNEEIEAGSHNINLNASSLASGVYFYRMYAGDFVSTKQMSLIK